MGKLLLSLASLLVWFALSTDLNAQTHKAILSNCISIGATGYNAYRNGAKLNPAVLPACSYVDTTVINGQSYTYTMRGVNSVGESGDSNAVMVSIPATPPPPQTGIKVGDRIKVNSTANIRATAVNNGFGSLLGTQPTGALGTVVIVSTASIPGVSGAVWINVNFDTGIDGYMGSDNMTVVTTPPPPPTPILTIDCVIAKSAFVAQNMPAGSTLIVTGTAAGKTAGCSIPLP